MQMVWEYDILGHATEWKGPNKSKVKTLKFTLE